MSVAENINSENQNSEVEHIPTFSKISHLYHVVSIDEVILLSTEALCILIYIRALRQMGKTCFANNEFLAKSFNCSKGTIGRALAELETKGRIERQFKNGRRVLIEVPVVRELVIKSDQGGYSDLSRGVIKSDHHKNNIIKKDLIKKEEEREEHPSGAVASLPRPSASESDFSSDVSVGRVISETETTTEGAGLSKTETVGVAETNSVNLQAMVAQAVKAELEKSALSFPALTTHSETRTSPQQGQEGAKMEPTEATSPVVSKPKAPKAARPPKLGIEDEIPEAERQIALSQLAEWLPTLQIKQDFRTEKLGKALQAFVIRRREKYLKRIKGFEEPLTRLGLQCQLTKAQKWGYEKCLESIWTAAGEGWKGFFEPRPTNQNGTYKTFKQLDEERAEESLKAWAERKQAEVKH